MPGISVAVAVAGGGAALGIDLSHRAGAQSADGVDAGEDAGATLFEGRDGIGGGAGSGHTLIIPLIKVPATVKHKGIGSYKSEPTQIRPKSK